MSTFSNQTMILSHETIEQACENLDKFVTADNNYDDLSKRLRVYNERSPNDSGLNELDYPSLTDDNLTLAPLPEVNVVKRVALPPELVEQFARMQCNCMMGLFAEINRAWLTIDNDIFVWNYETGGDLAYFDSMKETIVACGLVKPKKGTCTGIPYVLVLTTPIDIHLLGVTFGDVDSSGNCDPSTSDMNLLPVPLYSLPSDNIHFITVQGTSDGRIFLGAQDGSLHEVLYQAQGSWMYKKCRRVNLSSGSLLSFLSPSFLKREEEAIVQIEVDEGNSILFTRSERGSIQVYDLGAEGQASKVADMSSTTITRTASQILRTVDQSNFQNIIHISCIGREESVHIQLVAVTDTGVRLYFSVKPFTSQSRPNSLSLVHVRLPPGFSANTTSQRPSKVHMAHYKRGNLLMVSAQSDDLDLLWAMSSDCLPFQSSLMETQMNIPIGGRTWALTEEPSESIVWRRDPNQVSNTRCHPPIVVTQHMEQLKRYVLLSAQGSYIMHKLRPVDQLRTLLVKNQGYENQEVEVFFKLHRADQACATCLILICSELAIDTQVRDWATGAFFLFGGEPTYSFNPRPTTLGNNFSMMTQDVTMNQGLSFHPAQVSTPHPNKYGGNTSIPSAVAPAGAATAVNTAPGQVVLSGKHDGIYLYLARILGPLWNSKLASEVRYKGETRPLIKSRVVDDELGWFIEQMKNLQMFLHSSSQSLSEMSIDGLSHNVRTTVIGGGNYVDEATRKKCLGEAILKEKQSLLHALMIISRCLEILNLWKLACEHQFEVICKSLSDAQQAVLKSNTLKTFLLSDCNDVFGSMIESIVQQYLGDEACTDVISTRLRQLCPSLYSLDDAKCCKANEMLQNLKSVTNTAEGKMLMQDAMALYKEVSPNLNLQQVCQLLSAVHHYNGILDICLTTAKKRDPQDIALHYYKSGAPTDDISGLTIYSARLDCYNCILDTLRFLLTASHTTASSPSVPSKPGPPTHKSENILSATEAEYHAESLYSQSIKTSDELFHVTLYQWMIEHDLTDKLLQISSPYLESFLKRVATTSSADDQLKFLEVLWRYYEKNKNYMAAAKILSTLADRPNMDVNLRQRIEYLARAVVSAKSAAYTTDKMDADFVHELEERLDVARVQLMVLDNLKKVQIPNSEQLQKSINQLNAELMDITTLYGSYADPYDLAECKLAILHCAGHYDSMLIEVLWTAIIDREFENTEGLPNRMQVIENKIIYLAKTFGTNDKFFPTSYIIQHLEFRSLSNGFADGWVLKLMRAASVSSLHLLHAYDGLFKAKDPCWRNHGKPYHLLLVVAILIDYFLSEPDVATISERNKFIITAQDLTTKYLTEVQSSTSTNSHTEAVIRKFRGVQAKLQRSSK